LEGAARLIADLGPDEWDLTPKPKWLRWRTYNRHVERHDAYEDILDRGTFALAAKLARPASKSVFAALASRIILS